MLTGSDAMMNVSSVARRAATISHLFPHIQTNGAISSMTGESRLYHANSTSYSHSLLSVFMMEILCNFIQGFLPSL
jgi:hypothetical protein